MTSIGLLPAEGEIIADQPARSTRIKIARDDLLVFESSLGPGERGAAPHLHCEHADTFYVLAGELVFQLADERHSLPVGTFVFVPPGLVHGFDVGSSGGRYLSFHAPGRAFAELLRARRDGIELGPARGDSFDPPAGGGRPASHAVLRRAGEGEPLPPTGRSLVKVAGAELTLLECEVEPGVGTSRHFHRRHDDAYYVLAGEVGFEVEGETIRATAGTFLSVPPGVVHAWTNRGTGPLAS